MRARVGVFVGGRCYGSCVFYPMVCLSISVFVQESIYYVGASSCTCPPLSLHLSVCVCLSVCLSLSLSLSPPFSNSLPLHVYVLSNGTSVDVLQVSRTTLGIIGYGDIGRAAAVKAKAMGMKIIAQRRRPELSIGDGIADQVFGAGQVNNVGRWESR